jgi:hypothetical protein
MNILSPIGLCTTCRYIKIIKSAKGSIFVMCEGAKVDTRLRKYPVLPVFECVGYEHVLQSQMPPAPANQLDLSDEG